MWCVEPPDDCTCKWRNTSDHGGWDLVHIDQNCPEHSFGPSEADEAAEAQRIAEVFDEARAEQDRGL